MFDIGFWELAVIGVIALLVVGPERLPGVARTVGLWVGRIRRYVSHVKEDIERELHAEEVRQLLQKPDSFDELKDVAQETASAVGEVKNAIHDAERSLDRLDDEAEPYDARPSAPSVSHHAVDDDPFAANNLSNVAPVEEQGAAEDTPTETASDPHEQRPERPGQP